MPAYGYSSDLKEWDRTGIDPHNRFGDFLSIVRAKGWTLAQLRCDVPPSQELLDLMERVGLDVY